jgi:hypothetical protein
MHTRLMIPALALTLMASALVAQPTAVLSETRQDGVGLHMYEEISGRWIDSVGKSGAIGCTPDVGSRWTDIAAGPSGAVARWTLAPNAEGLYEAQVTWSTSGNAIDVTYRITAGGETATRLITQDGYGFLGTRNSNQWISLGTYPASPASPIIIEVSDETVSGQPDGDSPGRVYADAARLVLAGAAPVSPPPVTVMLPPPAPRPTPTPAPQPPAPDVTPVTPPTPTLGEGIAWSNDLLSSQDLAAATGRPLLVALVSPNSRDARRMEIDTWRDSDVIAAVSDNFVAVRINMAINADLCRSLGVFRSPTTLIMRVGDQGPEVVNRIVGYASASEMLTHLR